jgi:16S rRNA (adenine1518-N6/adenine1519-N6)-dimethyltransferase
MVRPKKRLGQHFLKDENIARKVVGALPPGTKALIEIGPGTGVLTKYLIEQDIPDFYAIEVDPEAVEYLKRTMPSLGDRIIQGDFLSADLSPLFPGRFSVIGNFPYNISSQILFRVLEYRDRTETVVGMFQKEVAERVSSPRGTKAYGILSVLMQAFYNIEILFSVSEQVFFPPPAVKSAVMRFTRNSTTTLPCDERLFFGVVKTAFNQRRKMLRNALQKYGLKDNAAIGHLLTKRAEVLGVEDFIALTLAVQNSNNYDGRLPV